MWAQLSAGRYRLPGPAVVMSPWVLDVRVDPEAGGFVHLTDPGWERAARVDPRIVVDQGRGTWNEIRR